jgi:hypothetical protein
MKCKHKTYTGTVCLNNAVIDGMCMNHFLQSLR